jgi:hypothetical protein
MADIPTGIPGAARLREDQIDVAAGILARAFQNDPPLVYGIPDAAQRARILPDFMKAFATYATLFGEPIQQRKLRTLSPFGCRWKISATILPAVPRQHKLDRMERLRKGG